MYIQLYKMDFFILQFAFENSDRNCMDNKEKKMFVKTCFNLRNIF